MAIARWASRAAGVGVALSALLLASATRAQDTTPVPPPVTAPSTEPPPSTDLPLRFEVQSTMPSAPA